MLSNMQPLAMYLFKFRLNKVKNAVSQLHWPHSKCSGQQPHMASGHCIIQCRSTEHPHSRRKYYERLCRLRDLPEHRHGRGRKIWGCKIQGLWGKPSVLARSSAVGKESERPPLSTMPGSWHVSHASAAENSCLSMGLPGPRPLDFPASEAKEE